jgi:hypothetical protein
VRGCCCWLSPDIVLCCCRACLAEPLCCCSTGRRLRSTSPCAKLQSQSHLDLLVESTSALVAGAAFRGALGKDRQSEVQMQMQVRVRVRVQVQVQVQRLRDLTVSRAGGSTAAKTVAKGPLAFQEQNCHGWLREMSRPIMLPPVATSKAPLTWAQSGSFADRAQAQNLDAAPPPPMHHVGMERHDSRKVSCYQSPRQALSSIALRSRYLSKPPCCSR